MPQAKEELPPAFEHTAAADLPVVDIDGVEARLIMGEAWGSTSPVTCHSPTIYASIVMSAGSSLQIDSEADERAVYLLAGDVEVDWMPLEPTHLVLLAPGHRPVLKTKQGAQLMLCGGAPMDGERHVWWNFVSSSRERINEAKRAWKGGEFDLPPDDKDEFIPLPEVPKTVSYP
jgi:redox-sensitive bicupin YhaK (pirin superfamily)